MFDHLQGELLLLADYLGPSRLYISIYESGSSDGTPQKLRAFQQDLNLLRIPNTIITDGVGKRPDQTRIEFLANARNIALAPLLKQVSLAGVHGKQDDAFRAQEKNRCRVMLNPILAFVHLSAYKLSNVLNAPEGAMLEHMYMKTEVVGFSGALIVREPGGPH